MLPKLAASLAAGGLGLTWYMGGFAPTEITDYEIGKQLFVYKDSRGDYSNRGAVIDTVRKDFTAFPKKSFVYTSIFMDNPYYIKDKNQERAVIGGMFSLGLKSQLEDFIAKHPEYHMVELKKMNASKIEYPYRNNLTYNFMNWMGLYRKLGSYSRDQKKTPTEGRYIMERYPFINGGENTVEILIPYGAHASQLNISNLPSPVRKEKLQQPYFIGGD